MLDPHDPVPKDVGAARAALRFAVDRALISDDGASWRSAIERLSRAAALGDAESAAQLSLLEDWTEADRWRPIGDPVPLCGAPVILALPDFLPAPICDWLSQKGRSVLRPARVFDERTGEGRPDDGRSNSSGSFGPSTADLIVALARRRISQVSGVPTVGFESTQVLAYDVGQTFDWHVDFLDPDVPGFAADVAERGQRIATCLIYLNDDFEGGETAFAAGDIRHRGQRGDALMWSNVLPDGRVDRDTVHAGLPPTTGRKYVLSQWIRDRPQPQSPQAANRPPRAA